MKTWFMLPLILSLAIGNLCLPAKADSMPALKDYQKLVTNQIWEGKNGKWIKGVFVKRVDDHLFIKDAQGNQHRIAIKNLSHRTRAWFFRAWQFKAMKENVEATEKAKKKAALPIVPRIPKVNENQDTKKNVKDANFYLQKLRPGRVVEIDAFRGVDTAGYYTIPEKDVDRTKLPNYNQSDHGNKASDCVPNSYAMFIGWWHLSHWINVPGRARDFDDKVDWIHKRLARAMRTRNTRGTASNRVSAGLEKFMSEDMMTNAAFTMERVYDYRPSNLLKHTQGANATVLMATVYYGRKEQGGHAVALRHVDADGTVVFHTWGHVFKGKLKAVPGKEVKWPSGNARRKGSDLVLPVYEIELVDPEACPEWFKNNKVRLVLDASKYDHLVVLTPYFPG